MDAEVPLGRPRAATLLGASGCVALAVAFALVGHHNLDRALTWVLVALAVAANFQAVQASGAIRVSAAFLCSSLAVAFLGAAPALLIVVLAEVSVWAVERYRPSALAMNVTAAGIPVLLAALAFEAIAGDREADEPAFLFALAAITLGNLLLNYAMVTGLFGLRDGTFREADLSPRRLAPAIVLNVAMAVSIAVLYDQVGLAAGALVILVVIAFSYMAALVHQARERTRQYANLSWGVLSGLIRTLDARDKRAARHCAATAKFARDLARHAGLSERDQELAHTAGLLHDIGRFALSDRVLERGVQLTEDDWQAIRRHPEIGADLLRDLGVYGPISEIILAHHERLDGKGYPRRLRGDEIPEIARIVAVAEVYDTLTAPDTYRTQLSSFEALTELRRVAGTQLDGRYVEALAELLAGQGTAYRHADDADYDVELAIERRMNEAAAP
ncbi:MAG: HD domain-containing protein [Solirubrobacterales bacterium]|nr:HD domain-containing protein [Solirubrobacterales bacterium]